MRYVESVPIVFLLLAAVLAQRFLTGQNRLDVCGSLLVVLVMEWVFLLRPISETLLRLGTAKEDG